MDRATVFYIVGSSLAAAAVLFSFVGLNSASFPSAATMKGILTLFAALVIGSGTFAVLSARAEQKQRRAEVAEKAETEEASGSTEQPPAEGGASGPTAPSSDGDPNAGALVFADNGCGACHTLADAETTGTTGPNLNKNLLGKGADYIRTAIETPSDTVAEGYPDEVMPSSYADQLSDVELTDLVAYLVQATER